MNNDQMWTNAILPTMARAKVLRLFSSNKTDGPNGSNSFMIFVTYYLLVSINGLGIMFDQTVRSQKKTGNKLVSCEQEYEPKYEIEQFNIENENKKIFSQNLFV